VLDVVLVMADEETDIMDVMTMALARVIRDLMVGKSALVEFFDVDLVDDN
jgi:hypothetical protein